MIKPLFFIVLLGLFFTLAAQAPKDYSEVKSRYGFPVVRRHPLTGTVFINYSRSDWAPEIYIAIAVQNDYLQFEKRDSVYYAGYEINAVIGSKERTLFTGSWSKELTLKDFDQTNSRSQFQYQVFKIQDIPSAVTGAKYRCKLEFRDRISHKSAFMKRDITFSPRHTALAFLTRLPKNDHELLVVPTVSTLSYPNTYWAFARFNKQYVSGDKVQIRLYRQEDQGQVLMRQMFLPVKGDSNAIDVFYKLPTDSMPEGRYLLRIKLDTMVVEKKIAYLWFEKPTYLYKYDLAVRPMRYIIPEAQWKKVKSMSLQELTDWFNQYWKARDPTPGTQFNELLNEFYQRVSEANRKFSTRHKEGWETDRGKILILYGPPKEVKNRSYSTDTAPHLIWIYDDNLQFVFVDTQRNGEFKLIENSLQ